MDEVLCPPGHDHSDSLKSDKPASFKRMLSRGQPSPLPS